MQNPEASCDAICSTLATLPCQLAPEDIDDFFSLAQYYAARTPQSFRKVREGEEGGKEGEEEGGREGRKEGGKEGKEGGREGEWRRGEWGGRGRGSRMEGGGEREGERRGGWE